MSNGSKFMLIFTSVCVIIIVSFFIVYKLLNEGGNEMASESRLSIEQRLEKAEEHNDVSMLQEKMPWLDIISARWKQVLLSDYVNGIPGPTDIMTTGLLTLDNYYLYTIREKYQWFENPRRPIPNTFLTDDMEGYVLYSSLDYELSYRPLFGGRGQLMIAIDFERGIVFFSF